MKKNSTEYEQNRERKNQIILRLDDAELMMLNEKVNASKLHSKSEYLRQLIVHGKVYYCDYNELSRLNYEIGKIGNNINQIAHRMNSQNHIYKSDIEEIKTLMEKVWQLQKSTLSWQP